MSTVPSPEVISNEWTEEFEQIFREHSQWVYRTAYAVTGNAEDAEDVLLVRVEAELEEEAAELRRDLAKAFQRSSRINSALCCRAQKFRPISW